MVLVFVFGWVFSSFLSVYLVPLRAKIPEEYLSSPPLLNFSLGILRFIAFGALLNSVVFAPNAYNMNCADNLNMGWW